MYRKILVLVFALSFLGAEASVITVDKSIALSPEQKSQTVNVSLSEIPQKLINKRGKARDGKVKLKFKLAKKDRKKFNLDPKNGKLTLNVVDGIVQPATLTITANDETEFGIYDYKILTNKKFRKSITKRKNTFEYNNVKTITGQIDLSNIVSTASLRDGIDPSNLVVEIYDFNTETKALDELIAQVTTDTFGVFNAEIPSDKEFGPKLMCQATLADQTQLRTFATTKEPIINAQSDYFVDFITGSDINLPEILDVDFAAILEQITKENILANTVQGVQDRADDIYDPALQKFAEGKKGNAKVPGAVIGFTAEFLLGQAFAGQSGDNQPIIAEYSGLQIKKEKTTVDSNQSGIFEIRSTPQVIKDINIITPFNDPANQGQGFFSFTEKKDKEAEDQKFFYTTINPEDNCLLMTTPPVTFDPEANFFTNKNSEIYDAILEEESGLLTGIGSTNSSDIDQSDGQSSFLDSKSFILPFYVQSTDDFNGSDRNKRNSLVDLALSSFTIIGFSSLQIEYGQTKKNYETLQGVCDSASIASSAYRNSCSNVSKVGLNTELDNAASQYIYVGEIDLGGTLLTNVLDMANYDWETATIDPNSVIGFEIKDNKSKTDDLSDLLLKPLFGSEGNGTSLASDSTGAFRFRDVILVTDVTGDFSSDEADSTGADNRALLDILVNMTDSKNGLPLTNFVDYKIYGVTFDFSSTTSSMTGISGKAKIAPGANNSYQWQTTEDTYTQNTSSLNNTNPENLAPTTSTDSVTNQTVNSIYNPGLMNHTFIDLHGTTRSCQFPNESYFFCQIYSSNIGNSSDSGSKSVGIVYGVKVENQPTQE